MKVTIGWDTVRAEDIRVPAFSGATFRNAPEEKDPLNYLPSFGSRDCESFDTSSEYACGPYNGMCAEGRGNTEIVEAADCCHD